MGKTNKELYVMIMSQHQDSVFDSLDKAVEVAKDSVRIGLCDYYAIYKVG